MRGTQVMRIQARGVTLLELMIAITVLGLLLGLAGPSFAELLRNNRVAVNTNELVVALTAARSEAVKRGLPVAVCASNVNQTACAGDTAADWSDGWLVFTDAAGTPGVLDGPNDEVLQRFDAVPGGIAFVSNNLGFIRFGPSGLPAAAGADLTFSIEHESCTGQNRRTVRITTTGRLHTSKGDCT
jgi:type IV fimbrial biogenesis protein FimT